MVQGVEQSGGAVGGLSSAAAAAASSSSGALSGQAMTSGSVVTVVSVIVVFAAVTLAFVLLQCYCDERRRALSTSLPPLAPSGRGRRRRGGAGGVDPWMDGRAVRGGVDPEVLRSLPVTVYRRADKEEDVECAVCLAELEDGEEARFLPRCGHGFHVDCVDQWLDSHSTCPLCRLTVVKPNVPPPPPRPLPPVPPEPANYTVNLPASVLLNLSDQSALTAVTLTPEDTAPSPRAMAAVLVIDILESAASTPRDAARSPGSARLRSLRRLWSLGRQGAGSTSSCSVGGDDDVEHGGVSVTVGIRVVEAPAPSLPSETETGATPRTARVCSEITTPCVRPAGRAITG
ncbi:hypothetical protein GUJ93_ZPchr0006g42207 [Zizania palustris]|uniref:RING-type E3 ubiquitin transferase n=1 Tax=Zizania palustris TaxID=103762 RepID=A0A8J5W1Q1_ZIZPA|nr:hypothetical protein GUJ93_ZPchr0006g42207 [Zizania palustris]